MSARSPFELVAKLPELSVFQDKRNPSLRTHVALTGLIGASRSLLSGALGQARHKQPTANTEQPAVVLLVVDGPEAALDAVADLRAFVGLDEAAVPVSTSTTGRLPEKTKGKPAKISRTPVAPSPKTIVREAGLRLESALFPAWDVLPTESDRPEGLTLAGRERVTDRLRQIRTGEVPQPDGMDDDDYFSVVMPPLASKCYFIIAPVTALMQPVQSPSNPAKAVTLRVGTEHDPIRLGRMLSDAGYDRVGQAEVRGEFALRGGILDIFPYTSDSPFRIDFLGETIESIKPFDPMTQRSGEPVTAISFADASPSSLKKLFSPAPEGGAKEGAGNAGSRAFSLFDHLPEGTLAIFQEPTRLRQRAELYQASLVSGNSICFPLDELLLQAKKDCDTLQLIEAQETDGKGEGESFPNLDADVHLSLACTTLQRVQGEISTHAEIWKKLAVERQQTYVFCETPGHRQRLQTLFDTEGVTPAKGLKLILGKLSGGFDFRAAGLAAISDREIMGAGRHAAAVAPSRNKPPPGTVAIQNLVDLQLGDHVVHAAHGIARYLGLARLEKSGRTEDYLTLLFANDVKLFVPAAHIGWISRYIGGHADLELSTIGSKVWARKKERAAKSIRDIAEDLLRVQAARKSLPGIVYPPDGEWQEPFEKTFPYEETADQLSAIEAVKKDMEATWPMDRLICGDVGFGKTEVALRAAFKAASSGKQVAVLAPTTLLAEQHGRTFTERFSGYPFAVEVLSRFKTPAEQRRLLERLSTGRVDVVIGTHRLLQKDVRFKDLGLAVIDEEQRFGVEHKEFFKQLRRSVDVMTLTATPIPRTLHMALLGLRDISNLTIPPRNRREISTKVARVSDDLLRRVLLREISRGGQVFVIHPRVHDIDEFKNYLANLVPEARFGVGHGQLDADDLEGVMARFLRGEIDVLVSTTIVESGLDIASANTMLIHEADRFGLSELHQLRGRVGRSDVQAYCYLLLPEKPASPQGMRRLRALEEFDELGAGFQLALKDLELRGAGNVLGRQQSGEIAEVGYDLYCKLLDATVRNLRGEHVEEEIEVNLQLKGAAYIPEEYVQDDKVVLELYRRLDEARKDEVIDQLEAEMVDRFGPLPLPAQRMFEEAKLRLLARLARVPFAGLAHDAARVILKLFGWDLRAADRALRGLPEARNVRVLDDFTLSFGLSLKAQHDEVALRAFVRNLLEALMLARQRSRTEPSPKAMSVAPMA